MIRMMLLPLLVVLLAASGYLHAAHDPKQEADKCSPRLGNHITGVCSSSGATLSSFSDCHFICEKKDGKSTITRTKHYLPPGLPCGKCMECCVGECTPINFNFRNPLSLKSCAK
uniref:Putative ixostatin n=1 Tax=Ixodes ricinus TaxID=34613 RepID=A0A0K8RC48_IXORI